ncbi:hypothetical protein [Propionivibrio sp.]|uniref:hypothetical protein n=1 Tax=Propionivibrio sp. TaxID=2212460 RepID=UPI003BF34DB8
MKFKRSTDLEWASQQRYSTPGPRTAYRVLRCFAYWRKPVLIVTDSPGAARQGATLNMGTEQNKVQFEARSRSGCRPR